MIDSTFLSWVHFGDLHIRDAGDENYSDLLELIDEVNAHLAGQVDFVFFPGDNADDGTDSQYRLVQQALRRLKVTVHAITGDHDRKDGSLDRFQEYLEPRLYKAVTLKGVRLLFLNAMDSVHSKLFDFSTGQMEWIQDQLSIAQTERARVIVFTHLYPSELETRGQEFSRLLKQVPVELVEMGHTHYNELANDGYTIYAATRSTGQIEEGPPGVSITTLDDDAISWKFKERGAWPFVMITSPVDEKLITRPESRQHVVRGVVAIHARVWGKPEVNDVKCFFGDGPPHAMQFVADHWECPWDSSTVPDGVHCITVSAAGPLGEARDEIRVCVNQAGHYLPPQRSAVDYENQIGAYPAKSILGTQLGPNEYGTKGPWPSWRNR